MRLRKAPLGGADMGYTREDLIDPRWVIQLGVAPVRIDVMSDLPGCPSFQAAWNNRVQGAFGSTEAKYLGLDDLIRAKEAAARLQDLADLRVLRRAKRQSRPRTPPRRKPR